MFKIFLASLLLTLPLLASSDQQSKEAIIQEQIIAAYSAMGNAAIQGPSEISLSDQAKLDLDQNYVFIPKEEAEVYMKAVGNGVNPNLIGLILSEDGGLEWTISIKYNPEGYIREDDAKNWNADNLLTELIEGTEESNVARKAEGYDTFHVVQWIEKPNYDTLNHKLIWSIEGKVDDIPLSDEPDYDRFVNYNTYAFGRNGYLQFTLMTDKSSVEANKVHAANILKATSFNEGNRYEDFVEGQDRVAEYGLAALIVGAAAKKLGLIGMVGVFLIKIWKIIAVGAVFAFGAIRRFFGGKKEAMNV